MIHLLPKSAHASRATDYRQIACCNVIYKVIVKTLARRLQSILPTIINPAQAGFVKGCQIVDDVCLTQEILRGYGRQNLSSRMAIKIDIKKAYDSVSWVFL